MASAALIAQAKTALRTKTTDADLVSQIDMLLDAALLDMGIAGVEVPSTLDALVSQAAITYVRMHFGAPDEYAQLKRSYDEQKAQLATATGYTNWMED